MAFVDFEEENPLGIASYLKGNVDPLYSKMKYFCL